MYMAKGGSLSLNAKKGKVREALRNPIDVLNSLRSKACNGNYCYERLYRNLYNEGFYLLAYQDIYASEGLMTTGADGKTINGKGMDRIQKLMENMKNHSYQPVPARRTYIEKKGGRRCLSGIPSLDDKMVQEIVRLILESIYEPVFSDASHGFRPNRSCHTALLQMQSTFTGVKWFIKGDGRDFFKKIDHAVLITILRRRIHDEYFIALIWKFLKAGYVEDWTFHKTYSGTAQGTLIGPILLSIYLNELDRFMENYMQEEQKMLYDPIQGNQKGLMKSRYHEQRDSGYRGLFYVRYANEWLCGVIGSKRDAEEIRADIGRFLKETLKLELSEGKTLITNADDKVHFLGYEIVVSDDERLCGNRNVYTGLARSGRVKLYVPRGKWQKRLIDYKALEIKYQDGKEIFNPVHRSHLINKDDLEIVRQYNAEVRGLYNYYRIADNVSVLGHFNCVMKFSMFKTFGAKYKLHISEVRKKYGYKHFGVKYRTKQDEKILYYYEDGFKNVKEGIAKPEIDLVPKREALALCVQCQERLHAGESD